METVEPNNHKEFVIGVLFLFFKFKIDCAASAEDKSEEVFKKYKNLFKQTNSAYLKKTAPIIHIEF